nr:unnamed protein product [Callosobruchus analis]
MDVNNLVDVIKQDSEFAEPPETTTVDARTMFNGGGLCPCPFDIKPSSPRMDTNINTGRKMDAYIEIVEQPAPKALRFRYECEGRSAGSIPGVNSTSDKKTFPTIRVVGYSGNAWVLVSCVTKDSPYRPHPHNLVGREGCTSGICRLQIPPDTMTISFPNLGIQCVKKKDIAQALEQRQRLQVDPFKTGYSHRDQPTSIDLNSVRLCFQVFLPDENNKYNTALKPVVSEPIYDKKAMSDLSITKLSHCNSYVAKDDIQIRFFEKHGDWEAYADIQPSNVHHQYAIWFQPPKYKTLDVTEPVPVCLQLRRPSDGACSEPVDFEFLPLDSGRPPYWSYRRNIPPKKANYNLFNAILANDAKLLMKRQLGCFPEETTDKNINILTDKAVEESIPMETLVQESIQMETNNNNIAVSSKEPDYSEVKKQKAEEKTFNEIINQVAQLDEIYADAKTRLLNDALTDVDKPVVITELPYNESFDDAKTYSSLQLAFKNPVEIETSRYEDVAVELPTATIDITANVTNNKRENDSEKLPPLPPKRTKKIETYIDPSDKKRKRKKIGNPDQFLSQLEHYNQFPGGFPMDFIKTEPREPTPINFPGSPYGDALSPASFQAAVTTGGVNMTGTWPANVSANAPQQMEQTWNIPSTANQSEKDICNMDSGEIFRRIYLPSNSSDLDFRDINIPSEQDNMQESLNRLENISLGTEQYPSPT